MISIHLIPSRAAYDRARDPNDDFTIPSHLEEKVVQLPNCPQVGEFVLDPRTGHEWRVERVVHTIDEPGAAIWITP